MSGAVAPVRGDSGGGAGGTAATLARIHAPILGRLERVVPEMHRVLASDLPMIDQVSRYVLGSRGKLLRPTFVLLAADVEERAEDAAITVAAVIELMHLATLIHDDSVDHSVLRRGLPTVNAVFSHEVSVIMGDFLYSRALRAAVDLESLDFIRVLTDVSAELTIGEMRQLGAVDALDLTEADYVKLVRSKTSSLLAAACEAGAMFGASRHQAALRRYGERLGIAFQIADDLLDYTEAASVMGKPNGLDLKEHKVTLPLIGALPHLTPAARARVEVLFASDEPSAELVAEIVGIVAEAGGLDYARQRGEQFAQEAQEALSGLPDSPARAALGEAIVYVMQRRT
jgi:octaprenyl-diphosphate synthase